MHKKFFFSMVAIFLMASQFINTENQFVVKKERRSNRRSLRQNCGEYCAQIIKKLPSIERLLAQLQHVLIIHKGSEKILLTTTRFHELIADIQEFFQQAIEDYWCQERQGLWSQSSKDHLTQVETQLKELDVILEQLTKKVKVFIGLFEDSRKKPVKPDSISAELISLERQIKKAFSALLN